MALKEILGGVALAVFLLFFLAFMALSTGYILVDDPGEAASQLLAGDVVPPEVGVEEVQVGPLGAPEAGLQDVDQDGVTVEQKIYVDNSANAVGGTVDVVEYDAFVSTEPDDGFEKIGNGTMEDLEVPPGERVVNSTSFDSGYDEFAEALGGTAGSFLMSGEMYMRIEGTAEIGFGPLSFEVDFENTEPVV
ncbi:MAG: hypothetical protein ACLFMT_02445 [Halobacteriales archaeon]